MGKSAKQPKKNYQEGPKEISKSKLIKKGQQFERKKATKKGGKSW